MIKEVFVVANFSEGDAEDPCLWKNTDGTTWLDLQVRRIQSLGRVPWLVIGDNGDEVLFKTKSARDLNLIYDTSRVPTLWTGLWSVGHGASNAGFVLPVQVPVPPAPIWNRLLEESQMGQPGWYKDRIALRPQRGDQYGAPLLLNSVAFKTISQTPLVSLATVAQLFKGISFESDAQATETFSTLRSPSEIQRWTGASP